MLLPWGTQFYLWGTALVHIHISAVHSIEPATPAPEEESGWFVHDMEHILMKEVRLGVSHTSSTNDDTCSCSHGPIKYEIMPQNITTPSTVSCSRLSLDTMTGHRWCAQSHQHLNCSQLCSTDWFQTFVTWFLTPVAEQWRPSPPLQPP